MPHFGPQTMASGSANAGAQHPTVNLVFAGPFWTTAIGQQDQATIISSTRSILSGPYLSGLTQYGSDGTAVFGQSWNDAATLPNNPSTAQIQNFLRNAITRHGGPYPGLFNDIRHAPIYVVVTDPPSGSNGHGWNAAGFYNPAGWLPAVGVGNSRTVPAPALPMIELAAVSVTVTVCRPAAASVTVNAWAPLSAAVNV